MREFIGDNVVADPGIIKRRNRRGSFEKTAPLHADVQTRCKDDVAFDQIRSDLHLLKESGIAHDAGSVHDFSTALLQTDDSADNGTLWNIGQLTDLDKRHAISPGMDHMDESKIQCRRTIGLGIQTQSTLELIDAAGETEFSHMGTCSVQGLRKFWPLDVLLLESHDLSSSPKLGMEVTWKMKAERTATASAGLRLDRTP